MGGNMPKTLLLADDSVTIQKVVGISFANEDIELVTVDNGDDAVTRAREMRPDIVLADVVMPGKNGYEVCEAIKQDPELASTPVLLLTGTFETFDEDRAEQVGADGHITKPFEAQALVDQVNGRLAAAMSPGEGAEPEGLGLTGLVTAADASNQSYDLFEDEVTAPSGVAQSESPPTTVLMDANEAPETSRDDAPWANEVSAEPAVAAAELETSDSSEPLAHSEPLFDEDSAPDQTQAFLLDEDLGGGQAELGDVDPMAGDTTPPVGDGLFSDDEPQGATRLLDPAEPADAMAQTRIDLGPSVDVSSADEMPSHARDYDVSSSDLGDSFAGAAQAPSWAEPMAETEPAPELAVAEPGAMESQVTDAMPLTPESDAAEPLQADAEAPSWAVAEPEPMADAMTEVESSIANSETDPGFAPESAAELVPEETLSSSMAETAAPWPAPPAEETTPSPAETVAIFPDAEPLSDAPSESLSDSGSDPDRISITEGMSALDQLEADAAPAVVAAEPEPAALMEPEPPSPLMESDPALMEADPEPEAPSALTEPDPEPMPASEPLMEPVMEPVAETVTEGAPAALSPMLERQLHDSIEKLAWDAFGDLSERLVKDAVERIEAVAWEVIPKMAETLIREEIRKLKDEE